MRPSYAMAILAKLKPYLGNWKILKDYAPQQFRIDSISTKEHTSRGGLVNDVVRAILNSFCPGMFSHSLDPKGTFEDQKLTGDIVAGSE